MNEIDRLYKRADLYAKIAIGFLVFAVVCQLIVLVGIIFPVIWGS